MLSGLSINGLKLSNLLTQIYLFAIYQPRKPLRVENFFNKRYFFSDKDNFNVVLLTKVKPTLLPLSPHYYLTVFMNNDGLKGQKLKLIFRRALYVKLRARFKSGAYCYNENFLFPKQRFSGISILFSDKGSHRNDIITRSFAGTGISVVFANFTDDTDFAPYNMVVPMSVPHLLACHKNQDFINQSIIPLPSLEAIRLCDNKKLFAHTLRTKGLGTFVPDSSNKYPYVLKKQTGEYSSNTYIINNHADEINIGALLYDPDYFTQAVIPGIHEYAAHIVFKNGKIAAMITIRYTYKSSIYLQGTEQQITKEVVFSRFKDEFTQILNTIEFEGLCCVDYKILHGKPKIFEINPRFGGSLCPYFFSLLRQLC